MSTGASTERVTLATMANNKSRRQLAFAEIIRQEKNVSLVRGTSGHSSFESIMISFRHDNKSEKRTKLAISSRQREDCVCGHRQSLWNVRVYRSQW